MALSGIETTEDDLIQFLERHRASLRKLNLDMINLATGKWPYALARMRLSVQLDHRLLEEDLSSNVTEHEVYLESIVWNQIDNAGDNINEERKYAIQDRSCSGKCPLPTSNPRYEDSLV